MDILVRRGYRGFDYIATGDKGRIYKSVNPRGALVAIKVVPANAKHRGAAELRPTLLRQLNIMAALCHPNCTRILDAFRSGSKVYIVTAYMPNGTISEKVRLFGPLCEWQVKVWNSQIVAGVKFLHDHLIAHRDLKLQNVLLDANYNPVISDYGLSRTVLRDKEGNAERSETFCGTPLYESPELMRKHPYDPYKIDIWCLGVMLFTMLNQHHPFDPKLEGTERMVAKQQARDYHFSPKVEHKLSYECVDLIHILLEPVPEKRPNIATVLRHDWFPIIMQEVERISKKASKQLKSGNSSNSEESSTEESQKKSSGTTNKSDESKRTTNSKITSIISSCNSSNCSSNLSQNS